MIDSKVWDEAFAYCSKPHPGNCALCGSEGVVLPFMKFGDGREVPSSEGLRGGVLIGHLICPCCSYSGCAHKSARWLQYDAVCSTLFTNKPSATAKMHGLSLEAVGSVIAWQVAGRPDFSEFFNPFAFWMPPQEVKQKTAALFAEMRGDS